MKSPLQEFIEKLFASLFSVIKVLLISKFNLNIKKINGEFDCVILGNGPSLTKSLEEDFGFIAKSKKICVNYFLLSDFYIKLKPEYYILAAPEFWVENPPTKQHAISRQELFDKMNKLTTWNMFLFIPVAARNSRFWNKIIWNNRISVIYYNNTPVEGFDFINHLFFRYNWGMPRPHNVLIPSIFLSINMGYKKIYLVGADHSWHEEIKVNDTNKVTVNHEHFYDKSEWRLPMYKLDGKEYRIHDVFRKLYLAFKGYFVLNNYAKEKNAKILNASKRSYIDAFEKTIIKKITEN